MATSDLLSNAAETTTVDGKSIIPVASAAGQPTRNVKLSTLASVVGGLIGTVTATKSGLVPKEYPYLRKTYGSIPMAADTFFLLARFPLFAYCAAYIAWGNNTGDKFNSVVSLFNNRSSSKFHCHGTRINGTDPLYYKLVGTEFYLYVKLAKGTYCSIDMAVLANSGGANFVFAEDSTVSGSELSQFSL